MMKVEEDGDLEHDDLLEGWWLAPILISEVATVAKSGRINLKGLL